MNNQQRVKIVFELQQDETGYPPASFESVWAIPRDDGRYEVDNIPFFIHELALGDVVTAGERDGKLRFAQLVEESGHSTLRVILYEPSETQALRDRLRGMGCESELSHLDGLIAVDVPPEVPLNGIRALLDRGLAEDRWDYEESALGQP